MAGLSFGDSWVVLTIYSHLRVIVYNLFRP